MKILFLPFINGNLKPIIQEITKDSMNVNIENMKRENENATASYGIEQNKFVLTDESGITLNDIKTQFKKNWEFLGNGMAKGTINGKPCSWIICHKGADLNESNIKKLIEIIRQHNLRLEHA